MTGTRGGILRADLTLQEYLDAREESPSAFSRRLGVTVSTVYSWLTGVIPRADTALKIIEASRDEPTPDGGTVTLRDLAGVKPPSSRKPGKK